MHRRWPLDLAQIMKNIRACEGETFQTVEGVSFQYHAEQDRIVISGRKNAYVKFYDLREILDRTQPPRTVQDVKWGLDREVWGSSYLYALINDDRIIHNADGAEGEGNNVYDV